MATYADSEVVSAAIERWHSRTAEQGPDSASQVRRLEAEISGNESAVQRYYNAFENGRLPEARFATRVDALERRLTELHAKLEEVRDCVKSVEAPSKKAVRDAEEAVRDAMLNGTPGQRKALLKELIVEVRVESRDSIVPTFRLPTAPVRVTEAVVGRGGLEPSTSAVIGPERCTNESGRRSVRPGVMWPGKSRTDARPGGCVSECVTCASEMRSSQLMRGPVLAVVLILAACGTTPTPRANSSITPNAVPSVSATPASSPTVGSTSPTPPVPEPPQDSTPPAASVLFAVVEAPSPQGDPDTVAIVGLDGYAKAKAKFQPRQKPYIGPVGVPMQGVAQVVGAGVYYIDGNGTVWVLQVNAQPRLVATFPQQPMQYETWYAVSPDGTRVLAGVVQFPAIGPVPSPCSGMCLPSLVGPTKFDLELAVGGHTTVLQHSESPQPAGQEGIKVVFPVGWTARGSIAMLPISLGTQNAWWGGPLYLIDSSGKLGQQLGGADCNSAQVAAGGFIACTSGQYIVAVRDSFGNTLWTTQVDGFNALSLYLSPDGQAISDGTKVERRTGGLVTLPQGFQVEGWLDNNTVVGRMRLGNGAERGNLSWISVSDPGHLHDLGFKGDFVGTIGSAA